MPCNLNQLELSRHVCDGVAAAGGVPLPFNTIAVSDNQSQGTPGMRASLVSREVIADSIELMTHAHDFDALVCLVGCDKTVPAALMALARAGQARGRPLQRPHARRAAQRHDPGRLGGGRRRGARPDHARRSRCSRARRVPGRRHVRRSLHGEHDGGRARLPRHRGCGRRARVGGRPGDESRGGSTRRRARHRPSPLRAHLPRPARAPQRDGGDRRHRRLDERRAAPARDRARGGRRADARRARRRRSPHAGDREPRAVRAATSRTTFTPPAGRAR